MLTAKSSTKLQIDFSKGQQVHHSDLAATCSEWDNATIHPWKPGEDLFFETTENGPITNIGLSCNSGGLAFNFGYEGGGPITLALNLLNQILPPGADGMPIAQASQGSNRPYNSVSHTANLLAADFEKEVVAPYRADIDITAFQSNPLDTSLVASEIKKVRTFKVSYDSVTRWIEGKLHSQ